MYKFIVTNGVRSSSAWNLTTRGSNFYLSAIAIMPVIKITYHETECHFSITNEAWRNADLPNQRRHFKKWYPIDERIFSIHIPESELEKRSLDVKDVEIIKTTAGKYVEMGFLVLPTEIEVIKSSSLLVKKFPLGAGKKLVILIRERVADKEYMKLVEKGKKKVLRREKISGNRAILVDGADNLPVFLEVGLNESVG